jgi:PII-like signaling protein
VNRLACEAENQAKPGGSEMKIEGAGKLIRIYIGNADKWHGQSLYNAIVQRAKQEGLAGVTVTQGIEGFGANSRVHRASILDISTDLPIILEIIDIAERINHFLPILDEMVTEGLIMVQEVEIVKYVHTSQDKSKK